MKLKAARNDRYKQRGVSLLEIMLVMVIAAMITAAAFMYYASVQRNKEINSAIQLIQQIIAAVDNYRHPLDVKIDTDGTPVSAKAAADYYKGLDANLVANSGFIPQQYLTQDPSGDKGTLGIATPWFGDSSITVNPYGSGSYEIWLNDIPNYACLDLAEQLKKLRDSNASCPTDYRQYEEIKCYNEKNLMVRTYPAGRLYCPS